MSFEPQQGAPPELSTTRVASGASARIGALAVAGVLVAVVGFAVVNRPPPPVPISPTAAAAAAAPTPQPTPTPPRHQIDGNDGNAGFPGETPPPGGGTPVTVLPARSPTYSYAVSMVITGGLLRAALPREVAENYRGSVVIASTDVGSRLQLELGREWVQGGLTIFESFGTWEIPLKALRRSHGGQVTLLVEFVPPNSTPSTASAVAAGYTFTVIGRRDGEQLSVLFDLVWPASSQAVRYFGPRNPGTFNRCRWDYGPLAAPPHGNNDEAGCLG